MPRLTDGRSHVLRFKHTLYQFATRSPSSTRSLPGVAAHGRGLQPDQVAPLPRPGGAAPDCAGAPPRHLGIAGVTELPVQDLTASPLDYVEGGALNRPPVEISEVPRCHAS